MILILLILIVFLSLPVVFWKYKKIQYRSLKNVPGPEPYPILGNVFPKSPQESLNLLLKYVKQYGNIYKLWIGPNPSLVITNPDMVEKILTSNIHITKSKTYDLVKPWIGLGLLVQTGAYWKARRRMITPSFHFQILEQFMDVFNSSSDNLVKKLETAVGKTELDIYNYVNLHSLDVICETSMGTKVNALDDQNQNQYVQGVNKMLQIFGNRFFTPWKRIEFLFTTFASDGPIYKKIIEVSQNFTNSVIQQKMANQKQSTETWDDCGIKKKIALIDTLIKPENRLTQEEIRAEIDTFMFEGHDTTSSGTSFMLYNIANNPQVQQKLYEEIHSVIGDECDITINNLNDMPYLDMVLKESQRLHSSVVSIERILETDFDLDGLFCPKGTTLAVFILGMHMNEKIFPEPHKFDPERFLPENISKRHKFAYVPFSAGPRNCIGQKFAIYEMKTTIIKVLQNYELSPVPGHKLSLGFTGVLKSDTGIKVRLQKRLR
ncbi:cytochrome P450 4C1 isoform X2 [Aethina tumida]|uniref:cytochrome P450 4C1 isoform X2 n=1 Tax=Aethina tumida TaxID=116153 RepID=UPI002147E2F0|nr:cytochrome P450 4C1 isoform X2 [Aethina tumida]